MGVLLARGPAFEPQEIYRFPQMADSTLLTWSPEGVYLAVLLDQGFLCVLDTTTSRQIIQVRLSPATGSQRFGTVAWSPKSQYLAYYDSEQVALIDVQGGEARPLLSVAAVTQLSWSPGGQYLAVMAGDCSHSRLCSIQILDERGNLICQQALAEIYQYGGLEHWLDEETLTWGYGCGTGCYGHQVLDVVRCRQTLGTTWGADYEWRPAGDYAAVSFARIGYQAYLMDRQGEVWPICGSPEPTANFESVSYQHGLLGWSPNGRELLLAAWNTGGSALLTRTCDLWIATVPQLSCNLLLPESCYAEWSPDGHLVSFFSLGEPVLSDVGQMIDTRFDPRLQVATPYLGILDLETRQILLSVPFVLDPEHTSFQWTEPWGYSNRLAWSGSSRYLVVDAEDGLYLWSVRDSESNTVRQEVRPEHTWLPEWSADSTAFYFETYSFQGETEGWIVHLAK